MGIRKKEWPAPEEICRTADEWTKKYRISFSGLDIIDDSPETIDKPRWNVARIFPSRAKIWQQREEILAFLEVIHKLNLHGPAVEIGLDEGGTHFIWRQLFNKVVSVEIDINKCVKVISTHHPDEKSHIVCGDSADFRTAIKVKEILGKIDMLFIDGDHQYASILCDYKAFSGLVKNGGIIAFHDTLGRHPSHLGVVRFLAQLSDGLIDGKKHNIVQIDRAGTGISYEIVKE